MWLGLVGAVVAGAGGRGAQSLCQGCWRGRSGRGTPFPRHVPASVLSCRLQGEKEVVRVRELAGRGCRKAAHVAPYPRHVPASVLSRRVRRKAALRWRLRATM